MARPKGNNDLTLEEKNAQRRAHKKKMAENEKKRTAATKERVAIRKSAKKAASKRSNTKTKSTKKDLIEAMDNSKLQLGDKKLKKARERKKPYKQEKNGVSTEERNELFAKEVAKQDAKREKTVQTNAVRRASEVELELGRRELARRRLLPFIQKFNKTYDAGWVHEHVCAQLERFVKRVENQESPRLMIFMPPRSGKSEIASKNFPAWVLGKHPEWEIIASSYAVSLPIGFSRKVQATIQDKAYKQLFPNTLLHPKSQSAEAWMTTREGGYVAAGVGGGITGKGAHIFIIDDPVKDAQEADSDTQRQTVWDWWGSTAKTRLSPGGGVLEIQCMTGDTPVLMATGNEKPLREIKVGDKVATYDEGELTTSRVLNHASQGYDDVLAITTTSGKIVRANERHPFLVEEVGERRWVKVRNLKLGQKIVTLKDNGVSGKEKLAKKTAAAKKLVVEDTAHPTIVNGSGLRGIGHLLHNLKASVKHILSIATDLLSKTIIRCLKTRTGAAQFASYLNIKLFRLSTGSNGSALTTTTAQEKFAVCCATTATCSSSEEPQSRFSKMPLSTGDFTTEQIVSIDPDGNEEVFDIQVERTENFIANVIVSSNTRWHDDDLAGRMILQMKELTEEFEELIMNAKHNKAKATTKVEKAEIQAEIEGFQEELSEIDNWEIIVYPAIAVEDEYIDNDGLLIHAPEEERIPELTKVRSTGEALHPSRYPIGRLRNMKRSMQPRHWSALYQQNPVPDEGIYFTKDMIRFTASMPAITDMYLFAAWDLAVGEKQQNDFSVGVVLGLDYMGQIHVVDMIRIKANIHKVAEAVVAQYKKFPTILEIGIEKGQLELSLMPQLNKLLKKEKLYPTFNHELRPISDKWVRARPLQGRMQMGTVIFPHNQTWTESAIAELLRFPGGIHDDIVDALAWGVRMMGGRKEPPSPTHVNTKSWKDRLNKMANGQRISNTPMGA